MLFLEPIPSNQPGYLTLKDPERIEPLTSTLYVLDLEDPSNWATPWGFLYVMQDASLFSLDNALCTIYWWDICVQQEITLDEYEKVLEEKQNTLMAMKLEERKVDAKEFESMQQLSVKKNSDDVFIKLVSLSYDNTVVLVCISANFWWCFGSCASYQNSVFSIFFQGLEKEAARQRDAEKEEKIRKVRKGLAQSMVFILFLTYHI